VTGFAFSGRLTVCKSRAPPRFLPEATACNEAESGSILAARAFASEGFDAGIALGRRLVGYHAN
jgi:hypothetical protein